MKQIIDLKSLREFLATDLKTNVFGVCTNVFNRLSPEKFIPDYRLLALRYSLDTEIIEKEVEMLSLEKGMGTKHINQPRNSTTVVESARVRDYIAQFPGQAALLPYKSTARIEEICQQNNWLLLMNSHKFGKDLFEDKIKFRKILEELGLGVIPGEVCLYQKLDYKILQNRYGLPFVIQHPRRGGGKGTFFIRGRASWNAALQKIAEKSDQDPEEEVGLAELEVLVAKFIRGSSPSLTACVTKHGILSTNLQFQLLDNNQLFNPESGSGLFCGHDWTSASAIGNDINQQAYEYVEKIGQYFKSKGYKGIFGLDFILDDKTNKLYIVETNPRLLGSFPVISMVQHLNGEIPILAFHLLEFLDLDYSIDVDDINAMLRRPKRGVQMIMHNLVRQMVQNHREIKAGVYRLENSQLKFIRPGYDLCHIKNEGEFVVADGVPYRLSHFDPGRRLGRVLCLNSVRTQSGELNQWADQVVRSVYQSFDLRPVKWLRLKRFFYPGYLAKG
ncbi:ATP-grasp domain-containing protein [Patescibacteria group bacterium]|nr:ATP-grasp domain-containing protein [Patescibacteria group bacterium]